MVLPPDVSGIVSGKPSEGAMSDADKLDLANMPATFDYEGNETSWLQGLPPGEMGPHLSELELSESDSGNSGASILSMCLHGFDGDARMSDAEGAQEDMQVGAAEGVNDPAAIPWCTTACSAGPEDVESAKVVKTAALLSGTAVNFDLQGAVLSENYAGGESLGVEGPRVETT